MSNTTAGTLWNLPNYAGQLFTASHVATPFLDRITMTRDVNSPEFAMSSSYDMESAAQPDIDETDSLTAPTAVSYVRSNEKNVCQIFQRKVSVSYARLAAQGRMKRVEVSTSGYAYDEAGSNPIADELAFQIQTNMDQMKMDMEYTFLNGTYQLSTGATVSNLTKGLITGSTTNTVAAGSVDISKSIMDELFKEMADNGSFEQGGRHTIFCNAWNKQKLTDVYSYVPTDRNKGGSNIMEIETDFGIMEIVYAPRIPATTIAVVNMDKVAVVFNPPVGKPADENRVIVEPLAKNGAGEDWHLFGIMGIDYGSAYFHGTVTGTTSS